MRHPPLLPGLATNGFAPLTNNIGEVGDPSLSRVYVFFEETILATRMPRRGTRCSFKVCNWYRGAVRWQRCRVPPSHLSHDREQVIAGATLQRTILCTGWWVGGHSSPPPLSLHIQDCYLTLRRPQRKDNRPDIHSNQLFSQKFSHNRPFQGDLNQPSVPDKNV